MKLMTNAGDNGLGFVPMPASGLTLSSMFYLSQRKILSANPASPVIILPSGTSLVNLQELINARWLQVLYPNGHKQCG
jgi:hypothetical protein